MKLCIAYPNRQNPSETFIYNHLTYLKPTLTLTGGWRPYLTGEGESIIRMPLAEPIRVGVKRGLSGFYPAFYTHFLTGYLRRTKPDVLLAEYGVTGCTVLESCRRAGVALVVHFHGFDASNKTTLQRYGEDYKKVFAYAKAVVAVSEEMAGQLIRLGADPGKVIWNPYGVETKLFFGAQPEAAEKLVLSVGRFTAKKAPLLVVRAFDTLLERHPDARLVMIGDGELLKATRDLVDELQLKHAVSLPGVKSAEEIAAWLRRARVFVQHSMTDPVNGDTEGTPNTILEASAAGLPIVSTRHAGIKEAVDHERTGFLVEEGDYRKMAEYLSLLLDQPDLAGRMGRQAREKMLNEYEMSDRIHQLVKILQA